MKHYALGVQYDGTSFNGFQRQLQVPTIQAELERALSQIAAGSIAVRAAGRTDAGVHATQQVVSFSTDAARQDSAWVTGVNSLLPDSVGVCWVREVPDTFDARFSALWRRYLYVYGMRERHQVFVRDYASWVPEHLDVGKMNEAAQKFLGEQDFSSIRAANCGSASPCRYIYRLQVTQLGPYIVIDVAANAFLLHMVRNIAAVLRAVGSGALDAAAVEALLCARNRTRAPSTAVPQGLYLVGVGYDDVFGLESDMRVPALLGDVSDRFNSIQLPPDYYRRDSRR